MTIMNTLAQVYSISCDLRTMRATLRLNSSLLSRHILAASMLAGDSSLGEESMEMMLIMIDSTCFYKTGECVQDHMYWRWQDTRHTPCAQGSSALMPTRSHADRLLGYARLICTHVRRGTL